MAAPGQPGGPDGSQTEHWADQQAPIPASKITEKVLEEKERRLRDNILLNYSRIKDVERELAELQVELRVNVGPKKHALELLRRKIEVQNERLGAARTRYEQLKKAFAAAEEALAAEERAKEHLCQELNLLVQQSASSQLEKLEQLTQRLELLNRGAFTGDHEAHGPGQQNGSHAPPAGSSALANASSAAHADKHSGGLATEAQAAFHAAQQNAAALRGALAAAAAAGGSEAGADTDPGQQSAAAAAAQQQQQQQQSAAREAALRQQQLQQQAAADARARHVALPGRSGSNSGRGTPQRAGVSQIPRPPAQQPQPPPPQQQQQQQVGVARHDASGAFRGWD